MKPPKPAFVINGQAISGSSWGMVLKFCNSDREQAAHIFYRAHCARAKNVMGWIRAGLMPGPAGVPPYARTAHISEVERPQDVRQWIDSTIFNIVPLKMNDLLREFAMSILQGENKSIHH